MWVALLVFTGSMAACNGQNKSKDTHRDEDGVDAAKVDAPRQDTTGNSELSDLPLEGDADMPLCVCPSLPDTDACTACTAEDTQCERRPTSRNKSGHWVVRCNLYKACLEEEFCGYGAPEGYCSPPGECLHYDDGLDVQEPRNDGVVDAPGIELDG
jgi:hypothetical protein